MMYKNSFRLFFSRVNLIWKILIYMLVVGLVVFGLCFACSLPIFHNLTESGFFTGLTEFTVQFPKYFYNGEVGTEIASLLSTFYAVISAPKNMVFTILFIVFGVGLSSFALSYLNLIVSSVLYDYMTCGMDKSFLKAMVETFSKNTKLALTKLFTSFILDILIACVLVLLIKLFIMGGMIILTPFIIIMVFVILFSLRLTVFCGWEPSLVAQNNGIFQGLKDGFQSVNRRFGKTYFCAIALVFTIIAINVFSLLFTAGACLVITLPASVLILVIFQNIMYFGSNGMRYYVEEGLVIEPKKLKETDNVKKTKYTL